MTYVAARHLTIACSGHMGRDRIDLCTLEVHDSPVGYSGKHFRVNKFSISKAVLLGCFFWLGNPREIPTQRTSNHLNRSLSLVFAFAGRFRTRQVVPRLVTGRVSLGRFAGMDCHGRSNAPGSHPTLVVKTSRPWPVRVIAEFGLLFSIGHVMPSTSWDNTRRACNPKGVRRTGSRPVAADLTRTPAETRALQPGREP